MNTPQHTVSALQQDPNFELAFRIQQPQPVQPKALLVLLHGVGSTELSLSDLAAGIDPHTLVVLPRGPLALGPNQCAWFRVAFTANGPQIVEREAEQARHTLIRFITHLQTQHHIAPEHTVVAGFSQGGIMSASVALSAPERVAGFGILSGRILPELAPFVADGVRLQHLQALVAHGALDGTLPVTWAERSEQWLKQLGVMQTNLRYPIGHSISAAMQADFLGWVQPVLKGG